MPLEDLVNAALAPSRTDIVRAKRLVLDALADGEVRKTGDLLRVLSQVDGVLEPDMRRAAVELPDEGDVTLEELSSHPIIDYRRRIYAAAEGLARLHTEGLLFPYVAVTGGTDARWFADAFQRISYRSPRVSSSVEVKIPFPDLAHAYRIVSEAASDVRWYLDVDIFAADLDGIDLGHRSVRCLAEALHAFRRGLYLAAVNVLGAAVEGAWFAAAEQLRHLSTSIDEVLNRDEPRAATVQSKVTGYIASRGHRLEANELQAHAALLRELRNYGTHPRPRADDQLERYFEEGEAGLLLLGTYRHLQRLSSISASLLQTAS